MLIAPIGQSSTSWNLQIINYPGRPVAGTYDILPPSVSSATPGARLMYYTGGTINPTIQTFSSTSGRLVVTSSSPLEVQGTFSFSATDGVSSVAVSGSFNAVCAPGYVCQ